MDVNGVLSGAFFLARTAQVQGQNAWTAPSPAVNQTPVTQPYTPGPDPEMKSWAASFTGRGTHLDVTV